MTWLRTFCGSVLLFILIAGLLGYHVVLDPMK